MSTEEKEPKGSQARQLLISRLSLYGKQKAGPFFPSLPQLEKLRDLSLNMVDLPNAYRQAGDEASAQVALQMVIGMAEHFNGSQGTAGLPLVTQLLGIRIERIALDAMDPADFYDIGGHTVQDRLDQLAQRGEDIQQGAGRVESLQQTMSHQDWITYNTRTRILGEENAMQWLLNKYGQE